MKEIEPWLEKSATILGRAYSPWTTIADVRQHLWVWALKNTDRIDEYLTRSDGEKILRAALNQEARNYCVKERIVISGKNPDDVAWYTESALKRTLTKVFDRDNWTPGGRGNEPVSWAGDQLAEIMDVSKALESMKEDHKIIFYLHYGRGLTLQECADHLEIQYDTARKRLQRGIKALSRLLNDPRPIDPMEGATYEQWKKNQHMYDTRSKGRRAMTNATARSITEG